MNPSLYFNILFLAFNTLQTAVVSAVSVKKTNIIGVQCNVPCRQVHTIHTFESIWQKSILNYSHNWWGRTGQVIECIENDKVENNVEKRHRFDTSLGQLNLSLSPFEWILNIAQHWLVTDNKVFWI